MKIKDSLIMLGKNATAVGVGVVLGAIISVALGIKFWLPTQLENLTLGVGLLVMPIFYILLTVIFFGIIGIVLGGLSGLIIFHAGRLIFRKNGKPLKR